LREGGARQQNQNRKAPKYRAENNTHLQPQRGEKQAGQVGGGGGGGAQRAAAASLLYCPPAKRITA
jgi:hypothetical protein